MISHDLRLEIILCGLGLSSLAITLLPFNSSYGQSYSFLDQFNFSSISAPSAIAISPQTGNVYVTDLGHYPNENASVKEFDADGKFITKLTSASSGNGHLTEPWGIAIGKDGYIYVADRTSSQIIKFDSQGKYVQAWGSPIADIQKMMMNKTQEQLQELASKMTEEQRQEFASKMMSRMNSDDSLMGVTGIALDSSGNIYVSEYTKNQIKKFSSDGKFITKWGSAGSGDGQLNVGYPGRIAVDSGGNVYIADGGNTRIQKFSSDGKFITKWGSAGSGDGQFTKPSDIAIDAEGFVYVLDEGASNIQKFTSDGKFITKWGSNADFLRPVDISVNSKTGRVYVVDLQNSIPVLVFAPAAQ